MLGILKVNAGVSTDGTAEFTITVVDVQDRVYEVQIDDIAYAQMVGVIEESTGAASEPAPEPAQTVVAIEDQGGNGVGNLASLPQQKREALAKLLAGGETPQHVVEGEGEELPAEPPVSLADVGFVDYSAEYDDEDDADPGELVDDDFVEPL